MVAIDIHCVVILSNNALMISCCLCEREKSEELCLDLAYFKAVIPSKCCCPEFILNVVYE